MKHREEVCQHLADQPGHVHLVYHAAGGGCILGPSGAKQQQSLWKRRRENERKGGRALP